MPLTLGTVGLHSTSKVGPRKAHSVESSRPNFRCNDGNGLHVEATGNVVSLFGAVPVHRRNLRHARWRRGSSNLT